MNTSSQNDNDNDIRQITSELEAIEQRLQAILETLNAETKHTDHALNRFQDEMRAVEKREARASLWYKRLAFIIVGLFLLSMLVLILKAKFVAA